MRREASVENLTVEQKSIRDKLLGFIKRRPTADLLVKKGIYQVTGLVEAVFVLGCLNVLG